jgi:hypothetical protein
MPKLRLQTLPTCTGTGVDILILPIASENSHIGKQLDQYYPDPQPNMLASPLLADNFKRLPPARKLAVVLFLSLKRYIEI